MFCFLMSIEDEQSKDLLENIYSAYHKKMYYIAYSILNNSHDAQDAVQTSIIKLIKYIDKTSDVKCNKTKHLIVTIVRNEAIDLYRKKKKRPLIELDPANDIADERVSSLDEIVIKLSEAKEIAEKLSKLKGDYADVLTLKYYYQFDDKEIADILNISNGNVRIRLNRAKTKLRNMMNKQQFEDKI